MQAFRAVRMTAETHRPSARARKDIALGFSPGRRSVPERHAGRNRAGSVLEMATATVLAPAWPGYGTVANRSPPDSDVDMVTGPAVACGQHRAHEWASKPKATL